jgi:osmotically-inducible protein OsmY
MKSALAMVGTLALGFCALAASASAGVSDAWITTKCKIALFTTGGVRATAVDVDTVDGNVTLHGKVEAEDESQRAESVARAVPGVRIVQNLLQVVPEAFKDTVRVSDAALKDSVEASLKAEPTLDGVKVASVNDGVVLLSGTTKTVDQKLRAVELAWAAVGVRRVASEIKLGES